MKTTTRTRTAAACAAAIAALTAGGAVRAEVSPWYLGVVGSLEHDSNVYRVGDNQVLPPGFSMSDSLFTGSLIGGFDQNISRQHVYGSMSLNDSSFKYNKSLNNQGYSLKLGLDWAAAERLSGVLTASADQNLTQFNNRTAAGIVETEKNIQNLEQVGAKFALGTVTRMSFIADLGWRKVRYSASTYSYLEYDEKRGSLGATFRSSGALTLGAAYRKTKTNYPNFIVLADGTQVSNNVNRDDIDLTADWQASGASEVYVRVSPTHIGYDNATSQSRSVTTGAATWAWQPGTRTKLRAALSRDTGQSAQANNYGIFGISVVDYSSLTTAFKLSGDYDLTGKMTLNASLTDALRNLSNLKPTTTPPSLDQGTSRSYIGTLGGTWIPTRSVQASCNFSRERRTSSDVNLTVPLSANIFSCYGQLVLQ